MDLISDAYRDEQRRLHQAPRGYGGGGAKWAPIVRQLAATYRCTDVLDYGCGQGTLAAALRDERFNDLLSLEPGTYVDLPPALTVREYDPAIPGKDAAPQMADLVVCTDVLEHVESSRIYAVAGHLATLTRRVLLVAVALAPSNKQLSDGRNAHILLRSPEWWRYLLLDGHDFGLAYELPAGPKHWVGVLTRGPQ